MMMAGERTPNLNLRDFELAVDPSAGLSDFGVYLMEAAAADSEVAHDLKRLQSQTWGHLSSQEHPLLTPHQFTSYAKARRAGPRIRLDIDGPNFIDPLVAALYMKAESDIRRIGPASLFRESVSTLINTAQERLATVPPGFFGDVIVQTEQLAGKNRRFAARLPQLAEDIRAFGERLGEVDGRLLAMLARNGDPTGDCSCIVHACNGSGDCQNFCIESWFICFLILIAIIVVIVAA